MSYLKINIKQKRRRKVDPLRAKLAKEREIAEVLRVKQEQEDNAVYSLISVHPKSFVYELASEGNKKQFRVPYTASNNGVLVLDFAEQTAIDIQTNQNNKEIQIMRIFKATEQSEMAYKKRMKKTGGNQMEVSEILYPAGVQTNTDKKSEDEKLKALQEQAEADGILLPTEFNRSSTSTQQQQAQDDTEVLMPVNY